MLCILWLSRGCMHANGHVLRDHSPSDMPPPGVRKVRPSCRQFLCTDTYIREREVLRNDIA